MGPESIIQAYIVKKAKLYRLVKKWCSVSQMEKIH